MIVPPQYFQSVIALELAVTGALLWQIRYFERESVSSVGLRPFPHPLVRLLVAIVLLGTVLGSLLGIMDGGGKGLATAVGIGFVVSLLPVLLRVLPPLGRSEGTKRSDPHAVVTIVGLLLYGLAAAAFVALIAT